jgi:hypothetical protein
MWQILSGREQDPRYRRLTIDDRRAIVEILRDTKKDVPEYFRVGDTPMDGFRPAWRSSPRRVHGGRECRPERTLVGVSCG